MHATLPAPIVLTLQTFYAFEPRHRKQGTCLLFLFSRMCLNHPSFLFIGIKKSVQIINDWHLMRAMLPPSVCTRILKTVFLELF
jgi:hypothetical protein